MFTSEDTCRSEVARKGALSGDQKLFAGADEEVEALGRHQLINRLRDRPREPTEQLPVMEEVRPQHLRHHEHPLPLHLLVERIENAVQRCPTISSASSTAVQAATQP